MKVTSVVAAIDVVPAKTISPRGDNSFDVNDRKAPKIKLTAIARPTPAHRSVRARFLFDFFR
jgi:hypothetical protein